MVEEKLANTEISIDWSVLKLAIWSVIGVILLGGSLWWSSYFYYQHVSQWKQTQTEHLEKINLKYTDIRQSLDIVEKEYLQNYHYLVEKGFFEEKQAISFQEQLLQISDQTRYFLRQIKSSVGVFDANWRIAEPLPYRVNWLSAGGIHIYETKIHLILKLLHEGEVLKFLTTFDKQFKHYIVNLQNCILKQLKPQIESENTSEPYIEMHCIFHWYVARIIE